MGEAGFVVNGSGEAGRAGGDEVAEGGRGAGPHAHQ